MKNDALKKLPVTAVKVAMPKVGVCPNSCPISASLQDRSEMLIRDDTAKMKHNTLKKIGCDRSKSGNVEGGQFSQTRVPFPQPLKPQWNDHFLENDANPLGFIGKNGSL